MDPMDVNEILAREMWALSSGRDPEDSRAYWIKHMAIGGGEWRDKAIRLRLALATDGIFVMRSRDV